MRFVLRHSSSFSLSSGYGLLEWSNSYSFKIWVLFWEMTVRFSFSVKQIPFEAWAVAEVHHNDAPCEMY